MSQAIGTRFGAYEITAQIGAGGMGEVYRARDTKLGREVAIKVLPASLTSDPDRLARFQREAQVLAALNHPNIAAIYHVEEAADAPAIVMELVEGETLADRITRGPIPIDEALAIARQIAEALEAAHEQGIVHRDLKPANVKVRPDGTVKVLDFGLAKLVEASAPSTTGPSALSMSPTITSPALMSGVGVLLGSAAYMSPEQARGKTIDKRADVWAFGVVLFEMLTGKRAFEDEDVSMTLSKVLQREPDFDQLPLGTPASVRQVIRLCLRKPLRERIPDSATVRLALDGAFNASAATTDTSATRGRHRDVALVTVTALVTVAVAALLATMWTWPAPVTSRETRFEIVPPSTLAVLSAPGNRSLAISADGTHIAYVGLARSSGDTEIVVRTIDSLESNVLPGTDGGRSPFFSADGRWVAFFSGNELKKVSVSGGLPITICNLYLGAAMAGGSRANASGVWDESDTIFFSQGLNGSQLQSVPAAGGQPKTIVTPDVAGGEVGFMSPVSLPSKHALIFSVTTAAGRRADHIDMLDLVTGRRSTLIPAGSYPQYVDTGHLLYLGGGTLNAVSFDFERLSIRGAPTAVVRDAIGFTVAKDGTLAYVRGNPSELPASAGAPRSLVWVDRNGSESDTGTPLRPYQVIRLSPDGAHAALDVRDERSTSIWVWDFGRHTLSALVVDAAGGGNPVWLPRGSDIAFYSMREGKPGVFLQRMDGTGPVHRLSTSAYSQLPKGVTPDGKYVLTIDSAPGKTVMTAVPANGIDAHPIVEESKSLNNPDVSADGHWLAYQSYETGRSEVYVRPFPDVNKGRWQASVAGGWQPVWAHSGRELFFFDGEGALTTVSVQTVPTFSIGRPTRLFATRYINNEGARTYDVSPDGQRFLMLKDAAVPNAPDTPGSIVVVQNWTDELKRLVPAK